MWISSRQMIQLLLLLLLLLLLPYIRRLRAPFRSETLRAGTLNLDCELVDPDELINQLRMLKSINVDGVVVDCWWGIVEAHAPNQYNWSGYKKLFQIVIMSFHEYGGNRGDDIHIPLPPWVIEVGSKNPDIFFTDREARRNSECLTWGLDNERVLRGRIALQVYYDYMRSFCVEFAEFLEIGLISEIKIGLGPCGELRYPSYPAKHGWKYPGIGEFQCYDKYLTKSLEKAAEGVIHLGVEYLKMQWYFQYLIDHARRVLKMANTAFIHTPLAAKLPCVHWSRDTDSLAAELIAGYHIKHSGYTRIGSMLRESHETALNIQCAELQTLDQYDNSSKEVANADKLFREARHAAWGSGINFATENILPCYDRQGYNRILDNAKPLNDPLGGYLSDFTYLRLSPDIIEEPNFIEFQRFVRRMHGKIPLL